MNKLKLMSNFIYTMLCNVFHSIKHFSGIIKETKGRHDWLWWYIVIVDILLIISD